MAYLGGRGRLEGIVQPRLRVPQQLLLRFRTSSSWVSIISYGDSREEKWSSGGYSHKAIYNKGADLATDMCAVHPQEA